MRALNYYPPTTEYHSDKVVTNRGGVVPSKVGGLNKAHKVINILETKERVEREVIDVIDYRIDRAVNQREARRAKRG
jgi:hypothetical protein